MRVPVDLARLQEFSDGTSEGLRNLVELFLSDTCETLGELAAAVAAADSDTIGLLAHRAGGSSSACGATDLAAWLFQLEAAPARTGDAALLRGVTGEFEAVSTFLNTFLEGWPVR